jgi:uncharacterized repeat protein (TIGR03943 family)
MPLRIRWQRLLAWLDCFSLGAWGVLLLLYWRRGDLNLLINVAYHGLTVFAAIVLLGLAVGRGIELWRSPTPVESGDHLALLPRRLSAVLLLGVAVLGFLLPPRLFASDLARQRSLNELTALERGQIQSFRPSRPPEERTLTDWVRTLNVYPEPDAYTGQPVRVEGFVLLPPDLPKDTFLLSRFVLTCCAADAYPIGVPVLPPPGSPRHRPDTWLRVEGQMQTVTLAGQRQVAIAARKIEPIPAPRNPYES